MQGVFGIGQTILDMDRTALKCLPADNSRCCHGRTRAMQGPSAHFSRKVPRTCSCSAAIPSGRHLRETKADRICFAEPRRPRRWRHTGCISPEELEITRSTVEWRFAALPPRVSSRVSRATSVSGRLRTDYGARPWSQCGALTLTSYGVAIQLVCRLLSNGASWHPPAQVRAS